MAMHYPALYTRDPVIGRLHGSWAPSTRFTPSSAFCNGCLPSALTTFFHPGYGRTGGHILIPPVLEACFRVHRSVMALSASTKRAIFDGECLVRM